MSPPRMRFIYTGVRVRDLQKSLRFYRSLGFRVANRGKMEHGGVYVQLKMPFTSQMLELNYYPKGSRFYERYKNGSELDHLGFSVEDTEECLKRLKKIGARLAVKPWSEGDATLAFVKDPDGIWIELLGHTRKKSQEQNR